MTKTKWDVCKIIENDSKAIDAALIEGYEPFAVLPVLLKSSAFDTAPIPSVFIYFKKYIKIDDCGPDNVTPLKPA
jgi:hypothetical protein